ncbi:MAG: hypothetical protein KAH95_00335 [Spirochaetales bacterium]|nr:hypothetical protein [Spirochaetales bacterium]
MIKRAVWLTGVISFFILFFINKEIGMLYGCSLIVLFSSVMERNRIWAFLPAMLVSWIWIFIGRGLYTGYSDVFSYSFRGVSLFPILAWPIFLFLAYLGLYSRINANSWWTKWIKISVIYSVALIFVEYFGYNLAGIHLDYGTQYPGWPILNIFHGPWWMQVAYFLNGIIFFGFIILIDYKPFVKQKYFR